MTFARYLKISFAGIIIETLGLLLDIFHHLKIGIETAEGLVEPFHIIILIGFIINFAGVIGLLLTKSSEKN